MLETTSITLTPRTRDQDVNITTKASSTPSPNAVQDFRNSAITNSNASDVVSDAIYEQLGVVVTDSEVIEYSSALALPELTEAYEHTDFEYDDSRENDMDTSEDDVTKRCSSRSRSRVSPTKANMTTITVGQRMLQQALSSLATPVPTDAEFITQMNVGNERQVLFYALSLGVTLNRGIDGYVRVVSASKVDDDQVRDGDIFAGDIVREVNDVDLRMPIDMAVWKMTIALMKMAPRPLIMVLAEELTDQHADKEEINASSTTCDVIEAQSGEDKKCRSATRAFRHLMKLPSAVDPNKGMPPTLEELSEEHLTSIELDHSRDAWDDFDECMLTAAQMSNLL
mmetsp:Transcript_11907/g.23972  ORF Transcript_11907/g.23972 Transcript_11907/m.23972 type:complete len:340 (-) Transcript_11907:3-1022(-)